MRVTRQILYNRGVRTLSQKKREKKGTKIWKNDVS